MSSEHEARIFNVLFPQVFDIRGATSESLVGTGSGRQEADCLDSQSQLGQNGISGPQWWVAKPQS